MVRCITGKIWDVVVDIRENSPTYLQSFGVELSSENKKMLYIPKGFAHGFQTLSDDCELIYHHTEFYKPNVEFGLRYDDPKLNLDWQMEITNVSDKDKKHPINNRSI